MSLSVSAAGEPWTVEKSSTTEAPVVVGARGQKISALTSAPIGQLAERGNYAPSTGTASP
jgi:hypothetical protein